MRGRCSYIPLDDILPLPAEEMNINIREELDDEVRRGT
jgi:hypothetical protein